MMNYKGKPLVRNGNTVYYGDMKDPFVAMLQIKNTVKTDDLDIANNVSVQILSTDEKLKPNERVVKKAEKSGLYEALNIADIWLERFNQPKAK
ncbi:MAG: hypothetical protein RR263_03345 [Oscillospiraceae bacterium]